MPLATLPLISSSSSATMSKSSSFLSSFKKPKSFQMNYVIATPRSANAKTLERGLPTVIFLHAVYLNVAMFHAQFSDPSLRRFNLVAVDFRGHGTTVAPLSAIPDDYSLAMAADDVFNLMDTLGLEKAHIAGVSMGATVGLYMAVKQPERVSSAFLMSPLLQVEPDEVLQGREEIGVYWREGVSTGETEALLDAARGAIQLLFGDHPDDLVARVIGIALPLAIRNWAETGAKGSEIHRRVTVHPFTRRQPLTRAELSRIQAPIFVTHSGEDLVTPLEGTTAFVQELRAAGAGGKRGVQMKVIPRAAHVPNTTWAREVNPLLADFLLAALPKDAPVPPAPIGLGAQQSPWFADLYRDQPVDEDDD